MRYDDNRCNKYQNQKNHATWLRAASQQFGQGAAAAPVPDGPVACGGLLDRLIEASEDLEPFGVIRVITVRRSCSSRQREISPRFSRRSSRRVMSGSRVIMRLAISPQGRPSGAPRRMRSTLYCVDERSSALRSAITSGQHVRRPQQIQEDSLLGGWEAGACGIWLLLHKSIIVVTTIVSRRWLGDGKGD